jgi:hypothetical protein
MARSALGDRRLLARAALALVVANLRYWRSVAPIVRRELKRWERHAEAIEDPELRALALSKLHGEGFHAEAAAMLATVVPRARRDSVVEAIVALELLFDYLDGLTERPSEDPLADGERLFGALTGAFRVPGAVTGESLELPPKSDGEGYLEALSDAVSRALARSPAASAITQVAQPIAARSGQAQTRMHAVPALGTAQLEEWARPAAEQTGLCWRELVAGSASSVLVLHALIAAAADPHTTSGEAGEIAAAYLPVCVLLTLLDGLVDHEHDTTAGGPGVPGYLGLYENASAIPDVAGSAARRAAALMRVLPHGAHHLMILVGVVAYYASAPGAEGEVARPVVARLRHELAPLMSPTIAIMRAWRSARGTPSSGAKGEGGS